MSQRFDHVKECFDRVDERFLELNRQQEETNRRMARLEEGFDRIDDNFAALNRVMVKFTWGVVYTMFAGFMAVLATTL